MILNEYKKLVRIRLLMDENLPKAKQILTGLINEFEQTHYKLGDS